MILRIIEILAVALIPFLTSLVDKDLLWFKTIISIFGVVIILITSIISLYKLQENWVVHRTTCDTLKHEKFLFLTKRSPYNRDESLSLLVQRIESLISKENSKWSNYMSEETKKVIN